jgi:hypothetical protein
MTRLVSLIANAPERILPRCSRNFRNPYFAGSKCDSDQRRKPPVQLMSAIVQSIRVSISKIADTPTADTARTDEHA